MHNTCQWALSSKQKYAEILVSLKVLGRQKGKNKSDLDTEESIRKYF